MNEEERRAASGAQATLNRLTQEHLAMLVCPVCRFPLVLEGAIGEEMSERGSQKIRCSGCARQYPIIDGLPVLLADRAQIGPR